MLLMANESVAPWPILPIPSDSREGVSFITHAFCIKNILKLSQLYKKFIGENVYTPIQASLPGAGAQNTFSCKWCCAEKFYPFPTTTLLHQWMRKVFYFTSYYHVLCSHYSAASLGASIKVWGKSIMKSPFLWGLLRSESMGGPQGGCSVLGVVGKTYKPHLATSAW